ncbi:hypothetical protein PR202_gb12093 [Eleusine coracana subsp. coracana]|uniref:Uncharacterized protein n=1 Tax=Eleusine coracana subsp. coracana TaxID=191504 RepID=A0AAV5EP51_ELECO|nr:hypothetical protein PR202_gb12093 [Eleusine coracana subsp. coracana]
MSPCSTPTTTPSVPKRRTSAALNLVTRIWFPSACAALNLAIALARRTRALHNGSGNEAHGSLATLPVHVRSHNAANV